MAKARTLKVGIAGLGVGSTQIIPAMAQMDGMRLVAAADFRNDALETFKQKYGGRAYDSVEKLCDDPEVEAVWVSTPTRGFYSPRSARRTRRTDNRIGKATAFQHDFSLPS
jgi:hypothetical protein